MHEWTYFQHFLTFIIKNKPQNNGGPGQSVCAVKEHCKEAKQKYVL